MVASRLLIPSALLLAALLGGCNAPDLEAYDPHAKFGADVVQKRPSCSWIRRRTARFRTRIARA